MADTPSRLPEEDKPKIRPDLRNRENLGTNPASSDSRIVSTPAVGRSGSSSSATRGYEGGAISSTSAGRSSYNSTSDVKNAEESPNGSEDKEDDQVGEGYKPGNSSQTSKGRIRFKLTRRRAAIAGVGTTALVSAVFGFFSISSGPLQLIHLDEILQKNFVGSNDVSKVRMRALYRYWKTGDVGETRVSALGSKVVGRTLSQLSDIGIEFQRNSLGYIKSATIDTGKLSDRYPELKNMSISDRQAFLAQTFGLDQSQLVSIGSGSDVNGSKFAVNTRDFGIKATRALITNSLGALDDGSVVTAIKFRDMAKFLNLPSLFRPLDRAQAAAEDKLTTRAERLKAESDRQAALEKPAADAIAPAESSLKDKLTGQNLLASALLVTTGMCLIRSVSDDVVAVNRGAIVIPSVIQSTDKIATGEQTKSGQLTASQAGGVADSFVDNNGKNIWGGKALEALAGMSQSGQDLPYDYKQAFSGDTTAQNIKDVIGGGEVGAIVCSTPGLIIQGIAGTILAAGSIIAAIPSGGASIAAEIAKTGAGAAATAGAVYLLQQQGTNILSDKALVPQIFAGPLGGNLLAYGGREAGNMGARASGGIPLNNTQSAVLDRQQQLEDQQQFRSENFFARTFDTKDYRSLTGQLADSVSPDMSQNIASLTSGFMHIGGLLSHALATLFTARTQAADPPYDWGFAKDGIPSEILNDPNLQNPYDNGQKLAKILDGADGQSYADNMISRAKSCFGSTVSKGADGWDATPAEAVNPNSDDYVNAHCGDISDYNWRRMILFVSDTGTMEAAACYQGDDQACQDIGYTSGGGQSAGGSGGGTLVNATSGNAQQLAQQILSNNKIDLSCLSSSVKEDVQDAANGKPATAGTPVSSAILQLIATVGQSHQVCVTAIESNGQGHAAGSYHYTGDAVDFGSLDGTTITGRNAPALTIMQIAFSTLPSGSALGQSSCGNTPALPQGWTTFDDTCNHLHIQVPRGTQ